jgi:hypothetical protein
MKRFCLGIFTTALVTGAFISGICLAQDTPAAPSGGGTMPATQPNAAQPTAQPAQTPRLAPGSVIPIQLIKGLDAKKAKTGDEVEGRVTLDLKAQNGIVIVPKDTKVMGHVTEAQAHTKDQKESQIGIAFDHAVTTDGRDIAVPASIQAIVSQEALNASNNNANASSSSAGAASSDSSPSTSASARPGSGGGMSNNRPASTASASDSGSSSSSASSAGNHPNQPITGNTQGVVGIADMQLAAAQGTQGSVVSSDKKNVKLDSGTLMLLRVNP